MFFFFYGYDFDYYNDGDDSDDFQGYYDVYSVVMLFLGEGVICRYVWNIDNRVIYFINNYDVMLY